MTTAEKLTAIAENQVQVYEAGQAREYDRFWDAYQQKGNRRRYARAFAGEGWTNDVFHPRYDMIGYYDCREMFRATGLEGDLTLLLNGCTLDTSRAGEMFDFFSQAEKLTRVGTLSMQACKSNSNGTFYKCTSLETVDRFIVTEYTTFKNSFTDCISLRNLIIEGTIANDMDLSACPLTRGSILSVLEALSAAASGKTVTFQQAAVAAAFTTAEWEDLVASKPNWNIRQQ